MEQLLLQFERPSPVSNALSATWGASAYAWTVHLHDGLGSHELITDIHRAQSGPLPICVALAIDSTSPPSPHQLDHQLGALRPWLHDERWFAPWGRPVVLVLPLLESQGQGEWLQRLQKLDAHLLELHHSRPSQSHADGVVLVHPHGEPPLPDQASQAALALQSNTYGPLYRREHRALWLRDDIPWETWHANALANTELNLQRNPGLVVALQPSGHPLPTRRSEIAEAHRRCRSVERVVLLHAFHLDLVDPILAKLENLLRAEGGYGPDTELFVTTTEANLKPLGELLSTIAVPYQIWPVANHGRDLLPLFQVLPDLLARNCQLLVKLHTKRSEQLKPGALSRVLDGESWRESLLHGLLDPVCHMELRRQLIEAGDEPRLTAPPEFLWPVEVSMGPSIPWLRQLLKEQGLELRSLRGRCFPAGNMFMANHSALHWLAGLKLGASSFELEQGALDGELGHAVERLLGLLVHQSQLDNQRLRQSP